VVVAQGVQVVLGGVYELTLSFGLPDIKENFEPEGEKGTWCIHVVI
jgi:hypothetical protein